MHSDISPHVSRKTLEELYAAYNRREFVHPDPVEFLYSYHDLCDREIVALIASSLAYGRVAQIWKSVSSILNRMSSPSAFLKRASFKFLQREFADFKHRFTTGEELACLLFGAKCAIERYGSLQACFTAGLRDDNETVLPALSAFTGALTRGAEDRMIGFLPSPTNGSACKRLLLFLRWMVRQDEVDPGGWNDVPPAKLVVPLDVHMFRVSSLLGLTKRRQADMRTAVEITEAFKTITPEDPVRYDFALTRLGIRNDINTSAFFKKCGLSEECMQH